MEIKEKREVTESKVVTVGYKCDACGDLWHGRMPNHWHRFTSHHNEWGNDSIESYEDYDVCSPECYFEKLTEVVEGEMVDIFDGEVGGMTIQFATKVVEYHKNFGQK